MHTGNQSETFTLRNIEVAQNNFNSWNHHDVAAYKNWKTWCRQNLLWSGFRSGFSQVEAAEVHALDAVSLQVNVGGFLCLVGPSGEDFFNRSLQSAARKGLAAFVDPLQFCQKQLLQRFVHQVAESAERPAEFPEMTVRDQLQARPLLRRRNVSFALGLLDEFV